MNNLASYRKRAGLTQVKLAHQLDVTQGHVSHIEIDRRPASDQPLSLIRSIVAVLNESGVSCTIDDVFPITDKTAAA